MKNEIKCFDKQMASFYEYIANKDRIIFNGSFRSGKTTFLKSFVNVHFKEMYYLIQIMRIYASMICFLH